jgi:hypothetical protein
MQTRRLINCWQGPAICPYPQHKNPVDALPSYSFNIHNNTFLECKTTSPNGLFASGFPAIILHAYFVPQTCYTFRHFILLDLVIRIFGECCRSWSSSLCSFLQPCVTSPFLGSNTLINTLLLTPSALVLPPTWQTNFNKHINNRRNHSTFVL